ncbi:prepilin-type N-terminal cleavage/methylation domain-containing protein [Nocardioides panacihumi]|uniref:Prepilin-type N-terminal cleavage/methylation domain-containing protein n=1 Tax=Nocardioides panacihumi TaxID=400774 RepID=A0ABN2RYE7_9ACTN
MLQNTLNRARNLREEEGGFTLIELVIVILVLGILAGIVVFSVRGVQDHGEVAACKTEVRTVDTAVEAFYANNTSYPANLGALTTDPNKFLRSLPTYVASVNGTTGALTMVAGAPCTAS